MMQEFAVDGPVEAYRMWLDQTPDEPVDFNVVLVALEALEDRGHQNLRRMLAAGLIERGRAQESLYHAVQDVREAEFLESADVPGGRELAEALRSCDLLGRIEARRLHFRAHAAWERAEEESGRPKYGTR